MCAERGRKEAGRPFLPLSGRCDLVRDWLKSLPAADRQILGRNLRLVELGWPLEMPLCRPLGGGLWELRSSLSGKRIARVFFCAAQGRMVLLHGFIKKTQKTPQAE
ncbi:MAG: type II toxin-antitoxin system RelE/ParE family toxin [Terracidiphilus sp.]